MGRTLPAPRHPPGRPAVSVTILDLDELGDVHWDAPGRTPPAPPPGWTHHVVEAVERGGARIRSSRIGQPNGLYAVASWLRRHLEATHGDHGAWVASEVTFDLGGVR